MYIEKPEPLDDEVRIKMHAVEVAKSDFDKSSFKFALMSDVPHDIRDIDTIGSGHGVNTRLGSLN